jgi:seryl-tRNA synthetase
MLELNFLRVNTERVKEGLKVRNFSDEALSIVDDIINLDDRRKATQTELDSLLAERNTLSKEIGQLFKSGQKDEAEQKRSRVNDIKEEAASLEDALKSIKTEFD